MIIDGVGLAMWTIYDHPKDFPDHFVARKWLITAGEAVATAETMSEEDLETLRKYMIASGAYCLPRQPDDGPVVVESWI
jgi:hypothetical protein